MPYYCTVPRCTSMAGKAKNVSFHQFPRDEELAKLWNKILKRGKPYTKYSKVCSLHFTAEDYTITSVGKNKGQWRTLRKDAVPSQNLPSESPTPYQRKQWGSWTSNAQAASVLDPTLQQQVAQAIYMQTMLAMQAARANELPTLPHTNGLQMPTESYAHTSHTPDPDILKGKQTNTNEITSFKCTECSKCFKDPDVFILHKRTHIKHEKNEKENFNLNVTLQANPILANLLKTDNNIFESNLVSMESLLMTALAANMEGYMRNFTSMIKNDDGESFNRDLGEMDHDRSEPDRVESNHDSGDLNRDRGDLNQEQNGLNHVTDYNQHSALNVQSNHREITSQREIDCDRLDRGASTVGNISQDNFVNHDLDEVNRDSNAINSNEINQRSLANMVNGHSLFNDRLLELCQNERNAKYYDNDRAQTRKFDNGTDDEGTNESDYQGTNESDDEGTNESDHDGTNESEHQGTIGSDHQGTNKSDPEVTNGFHSNSPICDLNESIDSNNLVIDESNV